MATQRPLVLLDGRVRQLPSGDTVAGATGGASSANAGFDPIMCQFVGPLLFGTESPRYYHPTDATISVAYASIRTTSVGAAVVATINKNGVAVGTVTLNSGLYVSPPVTLNVTITPSDYLTVVIADDGSSAADLTVYLAISTTEAITGTIQWVDVINKPTEFAPSAHTHPLSQISNWPSQVSATEVSYLDGVTSGIQAQLDNKLNKNYSINTQTGSSYTLQLSDAYGLVIMSNAAAQTLVIPADSVINFPVGSFVDVSQFGVGQVTISSAATLRYPTGLRYRIRYSSVTCIKVAADEWLLVGDLIA